MRTGLFFVRLLRTWMTRREVASVLVESLVFPLGVLICDALVASDVLQRAQDALVRDAESLQGLARVPLVLGHREEEVLGGDVLVAERLRFLLRLLQCAPEPRRSG